MAAIFFANAVVFSVLGVANAFSLRANGNDAHDAHRVNRSKYTLEDEPPCQCVPNSPTWKRPTRTEAKCIFIDLGAADGNTLIKFMADYYGPIANCPSGGKWEAILVEANPQFTPQLKALEHNLMGEVKALPETAAFTCAATTSFYIDKDPTHNHWGSSLSPDAPDAAASGDVKVTVPTYNVNQLIFENVIPQDYLILKVDIESAEYSVVPCLAQFEDVGDLVDRIALEEHWWFSSVTEAQKAEMVIAKQKLADMHVDMPQYYSETL